MPQLNDLKTTEELGSTCSLTSPERCTAPALYQVRLKMNNAAHRELREIIVLACGRHYTMLQAEQPDAIVAWRPYGGPQA